jgi:hypothetical protein
MNMNWGKSASLRAISTLLFCGLLLVALSSLAAAQSDAPPPPPPPMAVMVQGPGPGGGGIRFHQEFGEGFENKVVTGIPMSGDLVVTRDTTLADGNHIHNQNTTKIYRDADGRVRREVGFELNTPETGAAKRSMFIITDPVAGKRYVLNPQNKTAHVMPLHPPKHGQGPPPPPPDGEAGAKGAKHDDSNVNREQLGSKTINGLQAEGTRVTRTIAAGKIGNENPIQVVTERWYSTDLQLPLTTTHTDPMMGTVTTNLTNINRAVPDASLFQVPADYKTETGKSGDMLYMPMKP